MLHASPKRQAANYSSASPHPPPPLPREHLAPRQGQLLYPDRNSPAHFGYTLLYRFISTVSICEIGPSKCAL